MLAALRRWGTSGIPERPVGWLYTVARNRLIDHLRQGARRGNLDNAGTLPDFTESISPAPDRRDLLLTICSAGIPTRNAVVLSLEVVFGFGMKEIATLLGVRPKTIEVRLCRARAKLRQIDMAPPARRPPLDTERASVLNTLYVAFADGFSRPLDPSPIAVDLATESISLVEAFIARPTWATSEARALPALFYLQGSRLAARTEDAELVKPANQNRSMWRSGWIRSGMAHMEAAMTADTLNRYHLELAIAACYASTMDGSQPPWGRILSLYDELLARFPSPFARLNRAIAVGRSRGPESGLAALNHLAADAAVQSHPYYHSARAHFLQELHRLSEAVCALESVKACARVPSEVRFAERRIAALRERA